MANAKTAGIIGGISVAVIIGVIASVITFSSQDFEDITPTEIPVLEEPIDLSDSASLNKSGPDFIIDEEGNKRYVISAEDVPGIGK